MKSDQKDKIDQKSMGYMDLTGRFPYRSSRGNEYIMVAYNYDGNQILMEPVKNKVSDGWRPVFTSKDNDHVMLTLIV